MSSTSEMTADVSTLLPQDILVEILSKLPAKSLLRLRCVSKSFCALIADHGFGALHRSLSLTLPSRASVLISITSRTPHAAHSRAYYTLDFSEEEEENPRRRRGMLQANRVAYLDDEPYLRSSSSDGLFICVYRPNGDHAVCNVSTGQRIFLPTIQFLASSYGQLLGYDSESKRYKVLMSAMVIDQNRSGPIYMKYKHWVFTMGVDKSWREIKDNCSHLFYPEYCNTSVYIDGFIYFHNLWSRYHIVAFEVGCESFSVMTFPDDVPSLSYSLLKKSALLGVGGRLAMVLVLPPELGRQGICYMNVWTWEKSKECWEKITMAIPLKLSKMINNARLLRFATNHAGEIVLLCIYREQFSILVCNLKSEVWRKFDVSGVEDYFPLVSSWESVTVHNVVDHVFPLE